MPLTEFYRNNLECISYQMLPNHFDNLKNTEKENLKQFFVSKVYSMWKQHQKLYLHMKRCINTLKFFLPILSQRKTSLFIFLEKRRTSSVFF